MHTVLLVEDSGFIRIATERILTKAGYRVLSAVDGEAALQKVESDRPDLVLLDMILPKMGGLEVLQAIKQNPATSAIPVIVLSGLSQKNAQKLESAGAAGFLEKGPLLDNPEALRNAVARALGAVGASRSSAENLPLVTISEKPDQTYPCHD